MLFTLLSTLTLKCGWGNLGIPAESSEEKEATVSDKQITTTFISEVPEVPSTSDLNRAADTGEPRSEPTSYKRCKKWLQLDYSNSKKRDPSHLPDP